MISPLVAPKRSPNQPISNSAKAVLHGTLGKFLVIAANAATGIITARVLQPAGRGEQSAMILWPVFLASATTLGIPTALIYEAKRGRRPIPELLGASLLIGLTLSILVGVSAVLAMPALLAKYPPPVINCARLFLLSLPIGVFMLIARAVFEAEEDFGTSITAQWATPLITLLGLTGLYLFGRITPISSSLAYTLNALPVVIWLVIRLRRIGSPSLQNFASSARALLSYGIRSYGIDLCGALAVNVDQIFVINLLSPGSLGIYVVALSASRMLNICQASVVMVLLPKAAALSSQAALQMTERAARVSLLVTAGMALVAYAAAPSMVIALYGKSYSEAILIFRLLLIEVTIGGTVSVLSQAAMVLNRPGVVALLQTGGLALTIPLMLLLVPRFGTVGAAGALLASTTLRFLLIQVTFPLVLRVPRPRLWVNTGEITDLIQRFRTLSPRIRLLWGIKA